MAEVDEQKALFRAVAHYEPLIPALQWVYHTPNGGVRPHVVGRNGRVFSPEGGRLKAMGARAGVPDVLYHGPGGYGGCAYRGIALELKWRDNQPTQEQRAWLGHFLDQGYLALAVWGWVSAFEHLFSYLLRLDRLASQRQIELLLLERGREAGHGS